MMWKCKKLLHAWRSTLQLMPNSLERLYKRPLNGTIMTGEKTSCTLEMKIENYLNEQEDCVNYSKKKIKKKTCKLFKRTVLPNSPCVAMW